MDYTITASEEEMAKKAAQKIAAVIRKGTAEKPAVIGLATGSTPIKIYEELVRMHKEEGLNFKHVVTFNLDEYIVDQKQQPDFFKKYESYHGFMEEHLFRHVANEEGKSDPTKMDRKNIHVPDTMQPDIKAMCDEYEKAIKAAGGIDLQLVGIGENGHIGFCEPGSPLNGRTDVVNLTPETIRVNTEKFGFAVPQAVSMGLGTVMDAKEILLVANGSKKAPIMKRTNRGIEGAHDNPSKMLDYHRNASAIIDERAASDMLIHPNELKVMQRHG